MIRKTAHDFDQKLLDLYDLYAHGKIDRGEFLVRAEGFTDTSINADAMLDLLSPDYALALQVSFNDPSIHGEYAYYPSPNGTGEVRGYVVRPANKSEPLPAVLVIHENRGLNPYIEDVARRLAKAGFLALAPDGLTSLGGYPGNDPDGRELQAKLDPAKLQNDFFAGFEHLLQRDDCTSKVAAVGFCYGGAIVSLIATTYPQLAAGVPFYGRQPATANVPKIKAPLMIHMGELDDRINAGWPEFETALKANGKVYEAYVYENANHGFHNDSTPRYDAEMAALAWNRTIRWLDTYLK